MNTHWITLLPSGQRIAVEHGVTLHQGLQSAGILLDAPCAGNGRCGKCTVTVKGKEQLACQITVTSSMEVSLPQEKNSLVLTEGTSRAVRPDGTDRYVLAFDVGTTTLAAYLMDGRTGELLARAGMQNPQISFGADVISRIQHVMQTGSTELQTLVRKALASLTQQAAETAGILPEEVTTAAIVGNTAMHHLLLGIDPTPLTTPPYMPKECRALELPAEGLLPIAPTGRVRILPNIAGFVGADTTACLVATEFDRREPLTLLIDIGTNGEMVLGNRQRRIACSTAAGPAFEGANISCGMRGGPGAVDHVFVKDGKIAWSSIGDCPPVGICGSGLLDLVAVLLEQGYINKRGRLAEPFYLPGTQICLTQKDVREVQLAKAAIRAGIELMVRQLDVEMAEIEAVYLAGAFGSYLDPKSACMIGMIPPCLFDRIRGIGNAAGEGARLCALNLQEYRNSSKIAAETEFLELATFLDFQRSFVSMMIFAEEEFRAFSPQTE